MYAYYVDTMLHFDYEQMWNFLSLSSRGYDFLWLYSYDGGTITINVVSLCCREHAVFDLNVHLNFLLLILFNKQMTSILSTV